MYAKPPQSICEYVYKHDASFDVEIKWTSLEGKTAAKTTIRDRCCKEGLNLAHTDMLDDLMEWKLWNLHRNAQKREDYHRSMRQISSGMFRGKLSDWEYTG